MRLLPRHLLLGGLRQSSTAIAPLLPADVVQPLKKRNLPPGDQPSVPPLHCQPWQIVQPTFDRSHILPAHDRVYISLTSYDYVSLERWHSYAHRLCGRMGLTVDESFAMSKRSWRADLYKPRTEQVSEASEISIYERVITLKSTKDAPLASYIDMLTTSQPEGAKVSIQPFDESVYNQRFMPNIELRLAEEELASYDNPAVRRKKGWSVE